MHVAFFNLNYIYIVFIVNHRVLLVRVVSFRTKYYYFLSKKLILKAITKEKLFIANIYLFSLLFFFFNDLVYMVYKIHAPPVNERIKHSPLWKQCSENERNLHFFTWNGPWRSSFVQSTWAWRRNYYIWIIWASMCVCVDVSVCEWVLQKKYLYTNEPGREEHFILCYWAQCIVDILFL